MQRLKIDTLKFTGSKRFTSKDGAEFIAIPVSENNIYLGEKGAYLEITTMDNRDGSDQYGNDGFITVDLGKQRREAGEKGPIIGNWKHVGQKPSIGVTSPEYGQRETVSPQAEETDDIPF